jgi:hypothetical protein
VLPLEIVTQMLAPSKATPRGFVPALNVPKLAPSPARSLVTLLLPLLTTHLEILALRQGGDTVVRAA